MSEHSESHSNSPAALVARRAVDAKTKPIGSLGRLEDAAVQLSVLQGTLSPTIDRARVCVFAADHGVAEDGVSAYPKAVTAEMMRNFAAGGAAINVLARANNVEVEVIDVGVDADLAVLSNIRHEKVRRGSRHFLHEPAMTPEELAAAMSVGVGAVRRAVAEDVRAIGFGEMGIGNTTSAAALLSALTGRSSHETVGRGTGVSVDGLARKRDVVDRALESHTPSIAYECLRKLGGLEIAAIAGAAIEGARQRVAIIADGFISTVAVVCAASIVAADEPASLGAMRDATFFAHRSTELGHGVALAAWQAVIGTEARPLLDLEMRLGEGTGAALAIPLLRSAAAIMREMATFASADISAGEHADEHSVGA